MSDRQTAAQTDDVAARLERRRRTPITGISLKLDAEERPGWRRRWVNGADPMRVKQMEDLGYSPVAEKAGEGKSRTDGLGTRITRHGGRDEDGKPYHAILMETPNEVFAEGEALREQGRQAFEEAINTGRKTDDTPDGAYIPKGDRSTINHSG